MNSKTPLARLAELITDPLGHLSHTKLGNLVGMAVGTWVVVRKELEYTLSDDLLIWYMGLLITGAVISKGVSLAKGGT